MQDDKNTEVAAEHAESDAPPGGEGAEQVPGGDDVPAAEIELAETRDRYLRLLAEFENFRKRTAREFAEAGARAQAALVGKLVDALDDLGRFSSVDPEAASARDIVAGVGLVEKKLVRELEAQGLMRVGRIGEPFDPHTHEAIGSVPAPTEEDDQTVAAVFQTGYRMGQILVRPARVQVYMWTGA